MLFNGYADSEHSQCDGCTNKEICKFVGTSDEIEKKLLDISGLANTPFTITLDCTYRSIRTYSSTLATSAAFSKSQSVSTETLI